MIPRTRKLLTVAPITLAAALAGCGPKASRAPAPEPTPARAPVLEQVETLPAASPMPTPAPAPAATPMCDEDGRPLAGNVRGKVPTYACPSPSETP